MSSWDLLIVLYVSRSSSWFSQDSDTVSLVSLVCQGSRGSGRVGEGKGVEVGIGTRFGFTDPRVYVSVEVIVIDTEAMGLALDEEE